MAEVAAAAASSFALSKGRGKGHRMLALTLGTVTDSGTVDTGLDHIDAVGSIVIAAAAAAEDLTMHEAPTKGVIKFGATTAGNAIDGAYVIVIGSVKGYAE